MVASLSKVVRNTIGYSIITLLLLCMHAPAIAASQEELPEFLMKSETIQIKKIQEIMGTTFELTLYADSLDYDQNDLIAMNEMAFRAIADLNERVSSWLPDSQTTYINNRAAQEPVKVAVDIIDLILTAKTIHKDTEGVFDVTVGPLVKLWGFYKGEGHLPSDQELALALEKVGLDKVTVDRNERTVKFSEADIKLDFGGIGKGMALDIAVQIFRDYGITSATLHSGTSTVIALGAPEGEEGWTIRIKNPYNENEPIDEVIIRDECLSTSGSYEKFFKLDGKEYCHIFDPRTGRPVEGMLSATVIAPTGIVSDALSTAFFVLGEEKARQYCKKHPEVRAILVPVPKDGKPKPIRINFPMQTDKAGLR